MLPDYILSVSLGSVLGLGTGQFIHLSDMGLLSMVDRYMCMRIPRDAAHNDVPSRMQIAPSKRNWMICDAKLWPGIEAWL